MDDFVVNREGAQSRATLPYTKQDLELDDAILVHVKVLSKDLREVQDVTRAVIQQLKGLRCNDRPVSVMVSGEDTEVTTTNIRKIAAMVTPFVLDAMGLAHLKA